MFIKTLTLNVPIKQNYIDRSNSMDYFKILIKYTSILKLLSHVPKEIETFLQEKSRLKFLILSSVLTKSH